MLFQIFGAILLILLLKNINFFKLYYYRWKKAGNIPHFGHFPFLGSLPFVPLDFEEFAQFYIDQANKTYNELNKSVMAAWFGSDLTVIPLDSDAVKVITNSATELKKGRDYKFVERWLGPALLLGHGDRWHKTRKLVTPGFHFQKLEDYSTIMDRHARVLINVLREKQLEKEIDLFGYLKLCALDIISETTMGVQMDALNHSDSLYVKAVQQFNNLAVLYSQKPYYWFFNNLGWKLAGHEKKTLEVLKVLKDTTDEVISKRIEAQKDGVDEYVEYESKPDFLALLLQSYENGDIPFKHLREEVDTFLFAGHDTTSHALAWTVWCLANNQEVQEKLYQELEAEFNGSDKEFASPRIKQLPYMDRVFKETLRIFPAVPILERENVNELNMGGFVIPAGTTIQISPLVLHRNPKFFPNPNVFDPERFSDSLQIPPEYIPFSAGARNCVGQKFAQREAKIILAHIIHNFKITTEVSFEDNKFIMEVVLRPKLGVPVFLQKRF